MSSEYMDSTGKINKNTLPRRKVLKLLGAGAVVAFTAGCSSENENNHTPSEKSPDRREPTGPGVSPEAFEAAQSMVTEQSIRQPYSWVSSAGLTIKALINAVDKDGADCTTIHNDDSGDTIMLNRTSSPEKGGVQASIEFNSSRNQLTFSLSFANDSGVTSLNGTVQLNEEPPIDTSRSIPIPVLLTAIKDMLNEPSASIIEAGVQNEWKPDKTNHGYNLSLKFSDKGMYECRDGVTGSEETRITDDVEAHNAASRYCEIADGAYKHLEKVINK